MNQKKLKKLRKRLREERDANALVSAVSSGPLNPETLTQKLSSEGLPERLLMRRKDEISLKKAEKSGALPGVRVYQGGAILHPLSGRAQYQFAKKRNLVV